jgi:peptidoglycan/xylan/chitin deacetylase (PgdA/CDA1 family)
MPYIVKTPTALKSIANDLIWSFDTDEQNIYLTFDDGPTPGVTEKVLDLLNSYDAKATFFCIGGNVEKNPALYERVLNDGHRTGNHTWNHMNGWNYNDFSYFKNVLQCSQQVDSNLFRPPYGRIKPSQVRALKKRYEIVMWDVLSADWDQNLSPEICFNNVKKNAKAGSIIVFHDSLKAENNMLYALTKTLKFYSERGYSFKSIPKSIPVA